MTSTKSNLSPLAQLITDDCCGHLLGTEKKAKVVAAITALEVSLAKAEAEIVELNLQIAEYNLEGLALMKSIFLDTYKGKNSLQAWLCLAAELGLDA